VGSLGPISLAEGTGRVHDDGHRCRQEKISGSSFKNTRGEDVMPNETDDGRRAPRTVSRRNLFKQVAGAAAALSATTPPVVSAAAESGTPTATPMPEGPKPQASRLEALETLTAAEADTLEAIVARLIPTDANGPGAAEARAAHYIDRALTGPLRGSRGAYAAGLAEALGINLEEQMLRKLKEVEERPQWKARR
jgi:gluconate 2-dehydrogenase subunit 3-like protein